MNDIDIVESTRYRQLFQFAASGCAHADKQTVDGVINQNIVVDLWPHADVVRREAPLTLVLRFAKQCLFETIWCSADRCIGTKSNLIERQRWTHVGNLDRIDRLLDRVNHDRTRTTIANIRVIDVLTENTLVL